MYSKTLKKDCSYSYTVPCGHGKECMHSVWLLQHCNIWGMADLSQNLYSFASNTTGHLKGVSYHALIPLNKILLQNRWCFSLSFSLEFRYCFVAGVFCQFCDFIWSAKSPCESVQASPEPHFVRRWAFLIQNYMCLCVLFNVLSRFVKLLMEGNCWVLIDGY